MAGAVPLRRPRRKFLQNQREKKKILRMESGGEIKFPVSRNKRLAQGTNQQLNHIEISQYGLHWPDLDEDLSFRGLFEGDYGQYAGS